METAENLYVEDLIEDDDPQEVTENENFYNSDEAQEIPKITYNEDEEGHSKKPVKAKRVVRNPQPKLNAETLKGKRGLTALESYFDRVTYKERGYEEQDLNVILKTYEYWCHRLFPKYPFDECIKKIEQLGSKKPVMTFVKKIRLNMLYEDNVNSPTNDDIQSGNDDKIPDDNISNIDIGILFDPFDDLVEEHNRSSHNETNENQITDPPVEISEDQLERIRLNKERAEQRRREKLRQQATESHTFDEIESSPLSNSVKEGNTVGKIINTPTVLIDSVQMERIKQNRERAERLRREKCKQKVEVITNLQDPQRIELDEPHSTVTHDVKVGTGFDSQDPQRIESNEILETQNNITQDLELATDSQDPPRMELDENLKLV